MRQIPLQKAKDRLAELIGMASDGEEVVITTENGSSFKIVPIPKERPRPKFGSAKGKIKISEDFDAPLDDFLEYME
jgi:prevent-host-death family protein